MIQRPAHLAPQTAESFKDSSIVAAYRYRPAYPPETFEILTKLITGGPRRVLDVGCGTGNIARSLVEYVEQVDAVDFSPSMIAQGKQLPGGDHPRLNWLCGNVEEIALESPYVLVTAGESLHWMDWHIVLQALTKKQERSCCDRITMASSRCKWLQRSCGGDQRVTPLIKGSVSTKTSSEQPNHRHFNECFGRTAL